ncbi:hypothetical protein ACFSTD_20170 [Novosphingobium colocasiae]
MSAFARGLCLAIVLGLTGFLFYALATGRVLADQLHVWSVVWGALRLGGRLCRLPALFRC